MSTMSCRSRALLLVVVGAGLVLSYAPEAAGQKKHAAEDKARSLQSNIETSIEFYNGGADPIKVYWLDMEGKRQLKHVLNPGERQTVKTFVNHPWLLTDDKDNAVGLYYPDADKRVVTYGQAPPGPLAMGKGKGKGGFATKSAVTLSPKFTYLQDATVKAELKLTEEQAGKVKVLETKQKDVVQALGNLTAAKKRQKTDELQQEADRELAAILKPEQSKRLGQIVTQGNANGVFTNAALLAALNLTAEQEAKWTAAKQQYSTDIAKAADHPVGSPDYAKQIVQARKTAHATTTALLTPPQKTIWQDMVGEPFQGYVRLPVATPAWGNANLPLKGFGPDGAILRAATYSFNNWTTANARFLSEKSVQDALKLTPDQISRLPAGTTAKKAVTALKEVLTPPQAKQYQGVYLQISMLTYGPAGVYRYKEVQDLLTLTEEQKAKILAIGTADSKAYGDLKAAGAATGPAAVEGLNQATTARLDQVLGPEQRVKLKDMLGEPFKGEIKNPLGFGGFDRGVPKAGPGIKGGKGGVKGGPGGTMRAGNYVLSNWTISTYFLLEKSVQDELKMTADQVKNVPAYTIGLTLKGIPNGLLTPAQLKRYQGIHLQASTLSWGPAGTFRYTEVRELLKLTPDQQAQILAIGQEDSRAYGALQAPPPKAEAIEALNKATTAKLDAVLTPDQRARLKDFLGEPFTGKIEHPLGTRNAGPRQGPPGLDANPRPRQLFDEAQAHEQAKEYDRAVKKITAALELAPDNDWYLAYASHLERMAGRYTDGVKHALAAIKINPKVGWYYASVAFNAHAAKDMNLAREYCQKVVDLGVSQVGQANYDSARRILDSLQARKDEPAPK